MSNTDARITHYEILYQKDIESDPEIHFEDIENEAWERVGTTLNTSIDIDEMQIGLTRFSVTAIGPGRRSLDAILDYEIKGKIDPPANVANLTATPYPSGIDLVWDAVVNDGAIRYEIREGDNWLDARVVSQDFMGTSIYAPLDDAKRHTFHVRAIDEWNNKSECITSINAQVTRPDDVTAFDATAQDEHIQFIWDEVIGLNISYEIRAGDSWDSGFAIGVASGDSATFLHPGDNITRFWIKARSSVGLFSNGPRFIDIALPPPMNRHDFYHIDLLEAGWPGEWIGFEPGLDGLLFLTGVDGVYTFDIDLTESVRAQNQLKLGVKALSDSQMSWQDADFTWNDTESNSPWFPLANAEGVQTVVKISYFDEDTKTYKPPTPLITGDHEYQKAKVSVHMHAPVTLNGRACISQCRLDIRIPQRLTDGICEVPIDGAAINFDKAFYTVPQVMANVTEGTAPCLIDITRVTKTGLKVQLIEIGSGHPIAGRVHWSALGY